MRPTEPNIQLSDSNKGTVFFERKIAEAGTYGSETAGLFVQFDIDPADTSEQIVDKAHEAFFQAKTLVYAQLGIDYTVAEHNAAKARIDATFGPGVTSTQTNVAPQGEWFPPAAAPQAGAVPEQVASPTVPMPAATPLAAVAPVGGYQPVQGAPAPSVAVPPSGAVADSPPFDVRSQDPAAKEANKAWAIQRFQTNPGDFFDNRQDIAEGKANPRSPHLKHKSTGMGIWLS